MVALGTSEQIEIDPRMRVTAGGVLVAEIAWYGESGSTTRALHVWCRDALCEEAFAMFCELFVERLEEGDDAVGVALSECHEEFRRLVRGVPDLALSLVAGAIGELILLRDVTRRDRSAVRWWMGPAGGRHDFRRGQVAIEVKTSLRSETKGTVRITDLDQLDPPDGGTLFLHAIRLERSEGGSVSIPRLVAEIRAMTDATGLAMLEDALSKLGISADTATPEFAVLSRTTFEVREAFPRLTASRLLSGRTDPGVSHVTYDLSLDAASGFETTTDHALSELVSA
jgi:hypothetical protein